MMNDVAVELIGDSHAMVDLRQDVAQVARSGVNVLITGECGVGHDRIARQIHDRGPRALNTFAAVDCAGLPEALLESELFGHLRGSLKGACPDRQGALEATDGGTLFLGEIGEMPLQLQRQLLWFIETGEVQKIGVPKAHRVDVRIISATTRNLLDLVDQDVFLDDLFYRLNIVHLVVPPLRERAKDIPALVLHILGRRSLRPPPLVSDAAMAAFTTNAWPGNVRELENAVECFIDRQPEPTVDVTHLPAFPYRCRWRRDSSPSLDL